MTGDGSAPRRLVDIASVVRSKNAGPLHVTLDLMFPDAESFGLAAQSPALSATALAELYGVDPDTVEVIPFAAAHAIKVVLDRPVIAGSPGDVDVYGAQQHRPLLGVVL
ncbi:DUF4387 domain-containing protein [Roseomonas terrae]|jgi:hypothetical protein|uniref:DUF4387 domain-containing protein n=1 Tax=Neoroseomonas terrae TaxID=424799 RepID=A0ABS5EGJ4_9PROT|nr:DUF4387 domain-containing protein [Neoroseomonas terrae]MBR0650146.1 DUF4387 domain-containing protein [Neoroseomonas terrae]